MKFAISNRSKPRRFAETPAAGFTLAEVLAALLFMAIVIPVAMHGLQIASKAGEVAQRKAIAARIGERVLNEISATRQMTTANQRGSVTDAGSEYRYFTKIENWDINPLRKLSVEVDFSVQGQSYFVRLATIVDNQF